MTCSNSAAVATASVSYFGFCKLVVHDLEREARFYREVCALTEWWRADGKMMISNGEIIPIQEVALLSQASGGAALSLVKFMRAPEVAHGETIIGFVTDDIETFVQRAVRSGGRVVQPTRIVREMAQKLACLKDPEGHLIEVIESI